MKMLSEITLDFTPLYWIIEEILTNNKINQRFGTRYLYNIQGKIKLILILMAIYIINLLYLT